MLLETSKRLIYQTLVSRQPLSESSGHEMRVCVIGGTGHISTSIVRVLLAQGHEVTCFNRGRRGAVAPGAPLFPGVRPGRGGVARTLHPERLVGANVLTRFFPAHCL